MKKKIKEGQKIYVCFKPVEFNFKLPRGMVALLGVFSSRSEAEKYGQTVLEATFSKAPSNPN